MIAGALALALAAQAGERRYAIAVGANHGDPAEAALLWARRDAQRTADVLQELGGVDAEDLIVLEDPSADRLRRALRRVHIRILADRAQSVETGGPDETRALLFFYYSGHADAQSLHMAGSRLPLTELSELVRQMPVDVRLMVLDACRTGSLIRAKGATPAEPFVLEVDDQLDSRGMAIITSASAGEDAQESERLRGGVFTHHFLAGLQGAADTSADGRVTLDEAYRYSYDRTLLSTTLAPTVQHPSYDFDLRGRSDLVITEPATTRQMGRLQLDRGGLYVIFDPQSSDLVVEAELGTGGTLALPAGDYLLRRRSPDQVEQAAIRISAGGLRVVAAEQLRVLPYGKTTRKGYATQRRSAVAGVVGGGVGGPLLDGLSPAPRVQTGVRLDLPLLTLHTGLRASRSQGENSDLSLSQLSLGGEVSAFKIFDIGPLSAGLGVHGGADVVWQRFDTSGDAPDRRSMTGFSGPIARLEVAPHARWLVGLDFGADIHLLRTEDDATDTLSTQVVPHVSIDLARYLR